MWNCSNSDRLMFANTTPLVMNLSIAYDRCLLFVSFKIIITWTSRVHIALVWQNSMTFFQNCANPAFIFIRLSNLPSGGIVCLPAVSLILPAAILSLNCSLLLNRRLFIVLEQKYNHHLKLLKSSCMDINCIWTNRDWSTDFRSDKQGLHYFTQSLVLFWWSECLLENPNNFHKFFI